MSSFLNNIVIKGGPVMFPIIAASIYGWAIVFYKYIVLHRMKINTYSFVHSVYRCILKSNYEGALELCDANKKHPISHVFKLGIERKSLSGARLEKIMEQDGNNRIQKLEEYLGSLVSVVSVAPLLGFLGTITGLIRAFMSWEKAGANVTVNMLAGGMYQAMITTATGLIVAIPLYLFYNYFINRIKQISNDINNYSVQLIDILTESKEGK